MGRRDTEGAAEYFQQSFARACQLGDPCWEGLSARGLAMVAGASGDSDLPLRCSPMRSAVQPARRPVRLAGRLHPRRAMHSRPATPASRHARWIGQLRSLAQDRDAGTHDSIAAARRGPGECRGYRSGGTAGQREWRWTGLVAWSRRRFGPMTAHRITIRSRVGAVALPAVAYTAQNHAAASPDDGARHQDSQTGGGINAACRRNSGRRFGPMTAHGITIRTRVGAVALPAVAGDVGERSLAFG